MTADAATGPTVMTTVDGTPLKVSLQRAIRRARFRSFMMVVPLLLFILVTFLLPIFDMLYRGIDNAVVNQVLPRTTVALQSWDPAESELPPEPVYQAMVEDIHQAFAEKTLGKAGRRLNYEKPGMSSIFRGSGRKSKKITEPPYKEQLIEANKGWGDPAVWALLKRESGTLTDSYFLSAVDMRYTDEGEMAAQEENRQIYVKLFWRTLVMSLIITLLCLLLGYPVSYLLATLPTKQSNLLIILVLLPFWTSLLVRTTSWIALLQSEGVLNDVLVALGMVSDDGRLQMIHNQVGTLVAMTHILLPFMILPLYSVMKTIPPSYMRAARSLGANPLTAFVRVYMPNTVSGIGAGSILVFILAIGYYITPALVGGRTGTFISNQIADHVSTTLNWGLAAALGTILLGLVLVMYLLYDKIVGIDNMKLG